MAEVRAPSPGTVVEVHVSVSDSVSEDDELITIESMKMHIPVTAPAAGTVQSITVAEGDHVEEDDVVLIIE